MIAIPIIQIGNFQKMFNSVHSKFTIEVGDNKINFLNTIIFQHNKKIIFDQYQKSISSDRYSLIFYSDIL